MNALTHALVLAEATASTLPDPGILPTAPGSSGLPAGNIATGVSISLLAALLFVGWLGVRHYSHKLTTLVIGILIGTVGASGFIGALAWSLIRVGVQVVTSVGHAV